MIWVGQAPSPVPSGASPDGSFRGRGACPTQHQRRLGFTLAEVLAALVFMAIVIPVAVQGLRIANLAGQVGLRKEAAARVAERVLNELLVTTQFQGISQNGVVDEGPLQYRWTARSEPWTQDSMLLVTVEVLFSVQGQEYDVRLSTILNNTTP